jgi:hypothetical protein
MTVDSQEGQRQRPPPTGEATPEPPGIAEGHVHCPSCHRREHWQDGSKTVETPGGSRKPAVHPELAAWRTVLAAHRGETLPVVCACASCAQPMLGDGTAIPWTIHTPQGDLYITREFTGPEGPMTEAEAAFWAEETLRDVQPFQFFLRLFQAFVLTAVLTPILSLWVFSLVCFLNFVITSGKGP